MELGLLDQLDAYKSHTGEIFLQMSNVPMALLKSSEMLYEISVTLEL